jgi:hypothetical protein
MDIGQAVTEGSVLTKGGGLGSISVVEHFPSKCEAIGSILSAVKIKGGGG